MKLICELLFELRPKTFGINTIASVLEKRKPLTCPKPRHIVDASVSFSVRLEAAQNPPAAYFE